LVNQKVTQLEIDILNAMAKVKPELIKEDIKNASKERFECGHCGLYKRCKVPFMRPYVPDGWTGKVLAIAEAPGKDEDTRTGRPLTGASGKDTRRYLRLAGFRKQDVARTNANICRPPGNKTPGIKQIRACRPFLLHTIETLKPKVVICFGKNALKAIRNKDNVSLTEARGKLQTMPGLNHRCSIYATYHPAAVLHGSTNLRAEIIRDLQRIKQPKVKPPARGVPRQSTRGIDTEYTPQNELITLAVADEFRAGSVDIDDPRNVWISLKNSIKKADYICGHSIPGDIDHLVKLGIARTQWLNGKRIRDSLLLARMVDENKRERGSYNLENLICTYMKVDPWKAETQEILKKTGDARQMTYGQRGERCRLDAWATVKLAGHLALEVIRQSDRDPLPLIMFTHQMAMSLHRVGLAGAAIDMNTFHKLGRGWQLESRRFADILTRFAHKKGMKEFFPTNDDHLRTLLYDKIGFPVKFHTPKTHVPKVDKLALQTMLTVAEDRSDHKLIENLMHFNTIDKLASGWYESKSKRKSLKDLIELHPRDKYMGLLHFQIFPLKARTGRRASGGIDEESNTESRNSQNWAPPARKIIRSRWKNGKIAVVDFRKLEPCITCWVIGDDDLLDIFLNRGGYVDLAKDFFGKKIQEETKEYKMVKGMWLGLTYNMKAGLLAHNLWYQMDIKFSNDWKTHVEKTGKLIRRFFRKYPKLRRHIRKQISMLEKHQQVVAPDGAIRHLPHDGPETPMYWHLENQAVNFGIQRFASSVTGSALIDYEAALLKDHKISYSDWHNVLLHNPFELPCSPIINEVHDELDQDMHPKYGKRDLELLVHCATRVPTLRKLVPEFDVPLKVKVTVGPTWT